MSSSALDARSKTIREAAQKILSQDHFGALGISQAATVEEVKAAFVEAAKTWHPDRVPAGHEELRDLYAKVFTRLELARTTVADPARRARYVEMLTKGAAGAQGDSAADALLAFRKAEALAKTNNPAQAEPYLRRAISLAPAKAEYKALLVWLSVTPDLPLDRIRALVAELDALVASDESCERAYFYRATLRKRLGMTREAHADFAKAAALNPKNVDAAREVRLYRMRQSRAGAEDGSGETPASTSGGTPKFTGPKSEPVPESGLGGLVRKLFKR